MAGNYSSSTFSFNLQIARFDIPPRAIYPCFFTGLLIYLLAVFCNGTILLLIITQRSLHKPMYYILFNLPLLDLIGITSVLPKLLVDTVTQSNTEFYPTCFFQAFLIHSYGGTIQLILAVMSIDRYTAICNPLRYNSIMTRGRLCGLVTVVWGFGFGLVVVLFALHARIAMCKTFIINVFCDNIALLLLSCDNDYSVNNIYGLFITAFVHVCSLSVQFFSYTNIIITCMRQLNSEARSKAMNTCLPQIIALFLHEVVSLTAVLSYRIPNTPVIAQRVCGLLILTAIPLFNPIIFGMKTKDIRVALFVILTRRKVSPRKNMSNREP